MFLICYAPAVGHGFITDDFRWIVESRVARIADLPELFSRNIGFYRPLVATTFAADYAVFGSRALGYGVTNLALALACTVLLIALIRALGAPTGAAIVGGALWLLNIPGMEMAVLWISGRTALVLVAASLVAALGLVRGRITIATLGLLAALFSKEEAIALPLVLLAWLVIRGDAKRRQVAWVVVSAAGLAVYWYLRSRAGAFTIATAPPFYQLTFRPGAIADNAARYAIRTLTIPAAACALACLLLGADRENVRLPRRIFACAAVWIAGGFAITLFLPVRSSLYACFPSVGAAIGAAFFCAECWRHARPAAVDRSVAFAIIASVMLLPFYRMRTRAWIARADLSASALEQLAAQTRTVAEGGHIVLLDDRRRDVNLGTVFGTLADEAFTLTTGRTMTIWIEPPVDGAALAGRAAPCPGCISMTLRLRDGKLEPVERGGK